MHRGSPASSGPVAWPAAPIPPHDARPDASGDRLPSRGRGRDPRSATAAPTESPCSHSPQTGPPPPAPMSPMLSLLPRDHANPPNMVPAHRPPTICCVTTIADPRLLANLLSCRIYSVGNRSSGSDDRFGRCRNRLRYCNTDSGRCRLRVSVRLADRRRDASQGPLDPKAYVHVMA
jgi:hypothetical protein